jgi:hypothetical protein
MSSYHHALMACDSGCLLDETDGPVAFQNRPLNFVEGRDLLGAYLFGDIIG